MFSRSTMRKAFLLVSVLALVIIGPGFHPAAESAPLQNMPVTVKQPNGAVLHLYASGDEHYNWLHDKEGYTIIQDPETGYFVYAVLDSNGDLVSSGFTAGSIHPKSVGLKKGIKQSPEQIRDKVQKNLLLRQASLPEGREPLLAPKKGTINNLVVFIRFSDDEEFTAPIDTYEVMFNNPAAGANSLARYFREISYDQLSISSTFYPYAVTGNTRSYQDSHPRAYYRAYNAVTNPGGYQNVAQADQREETLVQNAVNAIATLVPSAINVDQDNDGNVDNICFIVYGSPIASENILWPHMSNLVTKEAYINERRIWFYNIQLEAFLSTEGVGVLAHEMLHSIGFPDLYHSSYDGLQPVHHWDIMGTTLNPPQHPGAYTKRLYGTWIDSIPTITTPGTYTLDALSSSSNNAYRINSPYTSDEYFLVEYRKKSGTFEGNLPNEGLLVYRINRTMSGKGNEEGPPDEVYIYRPGGTSSTEGTCDDAPYSNKPGRRRIDDSTSPGSFLSNGNPGGLYLYNVVPNGDKMSFSVLFPPYLPKTGQTIVYATRDDGEIQSGIDWPVPRFTVDGTCIIDHLTGLVWGREVSSGILGRTWNEAVDYAYNLTQCSRSDWRLPNENEIFTLLNASQNGVLWLENQGFLFHPKNADGYWYDSVWTSTGYTDVVVYMDLADLWENFDQMDFNNRFAMTVADAQDDGPYKAGITGQSWTFRTGDDGTYQSGKNWPEPRFAVVYCDAGGPCADQSGDCDGTDSNNMVIDYHTGLYWASDANLAGKKMEWPDAIVYANSLSLCGYSDWRLPNRVELRSLVDRSQYFPVLSPTVPFTNVQFFEGDTYLYPVYYWSSTTQFPFKDSGYANNQSFMNGWSLARPKASAWCFVWPVRTPKAKASDVILSITKTGAGHGTVTSYPDGIDCGPTCTFRFDAGQAVTLAASASEDSVFTSWIGCDSLTGNNCKITMNDDRQVIATFAIPTVLLTVNKFGNGSGTVTSKPFGINCGTDCSEAYSESTVVTLTAAADSDSILLQWSGCDSAVENTCTVALTANKVVGATFVPLYTLTAAKSGDGIGTVSSVPAGIACGSDCTERYTEGTVVTLTASPAEGSVFTGWSGGGCTKTGPCMVAMNEDTTVTAVFTPTFKLIVSKEGSGSGTVKSDPEGIDCGVDCLFIFISGVEVTLTATPDSGFVFSGWTGCDKSSDNNCTVAMVTDRYVSAAFNPNQKPNLIPFKPSGWSNKLVVSNRKSTHADTSPFYTTDKLYLDWAVKNNGQGTATGTIACDVYIDSERHGIVSRSGPLSAGKFLSVADYAIGSLSEGTHTIKIVVDATTGIDETNESDNAYTRTITVLRPSITAASPNGGEIWKVGTSNVISWTYKGKPGTTVKIDLLKGGVVQKTLTSSTPLGSNGSGSFIWPIPVDQVLGKNYKVRVRSNKSGSWQDSSNGSFSIAAP